MAARRAWGWVAGVLGLVCLVLLFDSVSCHSQEIFGILNENVTFSVSSSVPFTEIMWTKSRDKVTEWEAGSPVKVFPPFVGRVHLDTTSGNLTIFNLTSLDEAEYRIDSSSTDDTVFNLKVIAPLPSPTLNCTSTAEDITVHCWMPESYNYTQYLNYSWNCSSALCKNGSNTIEMLIEKTNDLPQEIHCIVSDPLSQQKSSLVLATCVPDGHSRHHFMFIPVAVLVAGVTFWLFGSGFLKRGRETERTDPS